MLRILARHQSNFHLQVQQLTRSHSGQQFPPPQWHARQRAPKREPSKKLTPKTWAQKSQPAQNETSSTMAGKAPSKAEYANFIPCWLPSDGAPLSENWRKTQICGAFLLLTHLQRGWSGLQDEGGRPWLYVRWHRGGSLGSSFHVHFLFKARMKIKPMGAIFSSWLLPQTEITWISACHWAGGVELGIVKSTTH